MTELTEYKGRCPVGQRPQSVEKVRLELGFF